MNLWRHDDVIVSSGVNDRLNLKLKRIKAIMVKIILREAITAVDQSHFIWNHSFHTRFRLWISSRNLRLE